MKQEGGRPAAPIDRSRPGEDRTPYLSTRGLVIIFAGLATALVLGYLLVNKLVDMSQEEDCALGHCYNCAAVDVRPGG